MARETFLLTVYCVVEEQYQHLTAIRPIRHGGFAPQLRDVEVLTMGIGGEFFQLPRATDLLADFRAPSAPCFPALTPRTLFVRQAANLWPLQAVIQRRLGRGSCHAADPVQGIAPLPLPVCPSTRGGRRAPCFPGQADYGYGAAKPWRDYGFTLGLRITRCGLITHSPLLATRPHAIQCLDAWVEGSAGGRIAADKGFLDQSQHAMLAQHQGIDVVTPPRARRMPTQPLGLVRAGARGRKGGETVGAQLTEHFAVARIRVRALWHFQQRLIRKIWAPTVGVFLHLQMGRQPLDLDGILTA